jgi:hypothetical protein
MKFLWGLARTWVDMLDMLLEAFEPTLEEES